MNLNLVKTYIFIDLKSIKKLRFGLFLIGILGIIIIYNRFADFSNVAQFNNVSIKKFHFLISGWLCVVMPMLLLDNISYQENISSLYVIVSNEQNPLNQIMARLILSVFAMLLNLSIMPLVLNVLNIPTYNGIYVFMLSMQLIIISMYFTINYFQKRTSSVVYLSLLLGIFLIYYPLLATNFFEVIIVVTLYMFILIFFLSNKFYENKIKDEVFDGKNSISNNYIIKIIILNWHDNFDDFLKKLFLKPIYKSFVYLDSIRFVKELLFFVVLLISYVLFKENEIIMLLILINYEALLVKFIFKIFRSDQYFKNVIGLSKYVLYKVLNMLIITVLLNLVIFILNMF